MMFVRMLREISKRDRGKPVKTMRDNKGKGSSSERGKRWEGRPLRNDSEYGVLWANVVDRCDRKRCT